MHIAKKDSISLLSLSLPAAPILQLRMQGVRNSIKALPQFFALRQLRLQCGRNVAGRRNRIHLKGK